MNRQKLTNCGLNNPDYSVVNIYLQRNIHKFTQNLSIIKNLQKISYTQSTKNKKNVNVSFRSLCVIQNIQMKIKHNDISVCKIE